MDTRKLIAIGAVVVGLLALGGLFAWTNSLKSDADSANGEVKVYVVSQDIDKGTPVAEAIVLMEESSLPGKNVPADAITNPEQINKSFIAVANFGVGHTLVNSNFASPSEAGDGLAARLSTRGLVSATVRLDATSAAAGLVNPGDYVNVLNVASVSTPWWGDDEDNSEVNISKDSAATLVNAVAASSLTQAYVPKEIRDIVGKDADGQLTTYDKLTDAKKQSLVTWVAANRKVWLTDFLSQYYSQYLLQKVEVLAVEKTLVADVGASTPDDAVIAGSEAQGAVVTLAVRPQDVQLLLNAAGPTGAGIYLSVVPGNYKPQAYPALDPSRQVAPGEDPTQLTVENFDSILNWADNIAPSQLANTGSPSAAADEAPAEAAPTPAAQPAPSDNDGDDAAAGGGAAGFPGGAAAPDSEE